MGGCASLYPHRFAGAATGITQILFFLFLAFLVVSLIVGLIRRVRGEAQVSRPDLVGRRLDEGGSIWGRLSFAPA
jgi:hypothetical protein